MSGEKWIEISERKLADFLRGAPVGFAAVKEGEEPRSRSSDTTHYIVLDPLEEQVELRAAQLVRVCDAFLDRRIDEAVVQAVGFLVVGSDGFEFDVGTPDGDRVMDVAASWATPEVNLPISDANMRSWRAYLLRGTGRPEI